MFDYLCEKCGKGTVRATTIENYETKFDGVPFTIPRAIVGICDSCDSRYFSAREWRKWRRQFQETQQSRGLVLSGSAIKELRQGLGINATSFAQLIGCSRQSLYYWESPTRQIPQSRMADLLLKLLLKSTTDGEIDVVDFLLAEAHANGLTLRISTQRRSIKRRRLPDMSNNAGTASSAIDSKPFERLFPITRQPHDFSPCINPVV